MPCPVENISKKLRRTPARHQDPAHARPSIKDAKWLAQFSPVAEAELTEGQRKFLGTLQALHPQGRVGRRDDGPPCFYAVDPVIGRFTGLLLEIQS